MSMMKDSNYENQNEMECSFKVMKESILCVGNGVRVFLIRLGSIGLILDLKFS